MTKEELKQKKFNMISLGCDKNRVDSEKMMYLLTAYGFTYTENIEEANFVIINTCAFINSAKQESVDTILDVAKLKEQNLEKLIVTGCLSQRYYFELVKSMPEVDAFVRIKNNDQIINVIKGLYGVDTTKQDNLKLTEPNRVISTPKYYAYLKIADGCNNCCSYCTIPQIRGRFASVPVEELIKEAKALVKGGVKELILVAQDVTNYGSDIYGRPMLVELVKALSKIKKLVWIRLHYCYPNLISDELLKEIDDNPKVCKYLDIPMQHASNEILQAMNRKDTLENNTELLAKIKNLKHYVSVRSTFIVGFPGETKQDFDCLKQFLTDNKLQNVGFFAYSREEYTRAYAMQKQVPEKVKQSRLNEVQDIQQEILCKNQEQFIGSTMLSVCEEVVNAEQNEYILRSQYNSPNVDTVIYAISNKPLKIGEFYNVKITELNGLDLKGEIL